MNIKIITDFTLKDENNIENIISELDIDNMTPLEALIKLNELKEKIKIGKRCRRD